MVGVREEVYRHVDKIAANFPADHAVSYVVQVDGTSGVATDVERRPSPENSVGIDLLAAAEGTARILADEPTGPAPPNSELADLGIDHLVGS